MAVAPLPMSETEFQSEVVKAAKKRGWKSYHTKDSRGSERGWPDLVLARPPRIVFAELKRTGKNPTPEQIEWLDTLDACGQEAYVWRPEDMAEVLEVLA
jgi:hypothetical protein